MKTWLHKKWTLLTRPECPTPSSALPVKSDPLVFFRVIPDSRSENETEILTGGDLRQALYTAKSLKSLSVAMDCAEKEGIPFLKHSTPENIFLIFGEHPESLYRALFSLPVSPERLSNPRIPVHNSPVPETDGDVEYKSVILCKIKGSSRIYEFFNMCPQNSENNEWTFTMNWLEFFNLREKQEVTGSPLLQE